MHLDEFLIQQIHLNLFTRIVRNHLIHSLVVDLDIAQHLELTHTEGWGKLGPAWESTYPVMEVKDLGMYGCNIFMEKKYRTYKKKPLSTLSLQPLSKRKVSSVVSRFRPSGSRFAGAMRGRLVQFLFLSVLHLRSLDLAGPVDVADLGLLCRLCCVQAVVWLRARGCPVPLRTGPGVLPQGSWVASFRL